MMQYNEILSKLKEFIELYYKPQILERIRKDQKFLEIDYSDLIKYTPEIAAQILDHPEEILKIASIAIQELGTLGNVSDFIARIKNLPETQKIKISDIRSKHINKLLLLEASVRQKSDVRPQAVSAKFECPSCGNILNVLQTSVKFKEPTRCGCGRKGKFKLIEKEMVDAQGIVLEENIDDIEGSEQPRRLNLLLTRDLVSPISDKRNQAGSVVRCIGILKEVPVTLRDGSKSVKFDLMIDVVYIENIEEDFDSLLITKQDEEDIIDLSNKHDLFDLLKESIAPNLWGYDEIKEALLLQLAGGIKKIRSDGTKIRGDMHILLVGDPSAGKSQIIKRVCKVAPKGRFVSGKGASGAGMTACLVRDEFTNGFALEAGALVRANKGFCGIDELDKMNKDDTDAMHEALEGQTVPINKGNVQATLKAETTVLAACNPKDSRFDEYTLLSKQIDLPSTLLSRFDFIFIIRDKPEKEKDLKVSQFIFNMHMKPQGMESKLSTEFLKKYFTYARKIKPQLTEEVGIVLNDYFIKMRQGKVDMYGNPEESNSPISITYRQLEGLIRASEASAKLRLSNKVEAKDAVRAINIMTYCLMQIGYDAERGVIDIDRFTSDSTYDEKWLSKVIISYIDSQEFIGKKSIEKDTIMSDLMAKHKSLKESLFDKAFELLNKHGEIFFPRPHLIQRL